MKTQLLLMQKYFLLWPCLVLVTAFILFSAKARAQTSVNELDERFKLEKSIAERLEQTLKTRLDKSFFDITVELKLKMRPVGISAQRLEQLRNTENFKSLYTSELNQALKQNSRPFELESLKITLGLSDQIDPAYRENLKNWLKTWVDSMFGKIGEAQVILRPSNVTQSGASNKGSFWFFISEIMVKYQNLLGMMFLGLVVIFLRYFPSNKKSLALPVEPMTHIKMLPMGETPSQEPLLVTSEDPAMKTNILSVKKKIAWLSSGMYSHTDNLIARWVEKDSRGHLKIAAYLEALAEGGASLPELARAPIPILPPVVHAQLPKTLAALNEMDLGSQQKIFQEVYSDLLAGEYQDKEPRHRDFEFLLKWSISDLAQVFNSLERACQVTFLSRLPQDYRKKVSAEIDQSVLRDVLQFSLENQAATDQRLLQELMTREEKHHPKAKKMSAEFIYNIVKLREAWSVLPPLEEALWLHQAVTNYPELRDKLNQYKDNVAFMSELPTDVLKKICMMTKTRELAALIKLLPFLREPILSVCGEMMKKDIFNEEVLLVEPNLTVNFNRFVEAYKKNLKEAQFDFGDPSIGTEKDVA